MSFLCLCSHRNLFYIQSPFIPNTLRKPMPWRHRSSATVRKMKTKVNHQQYEHEHHLRSLCTRSHQGISTQITLTSQSQDFEFMRGPSQKPELPENKEPIIMQIVLILKKRGHEKISKQNCIIPPGFKNSSPKFE